MRELTICSREKDVFMIWIKRIETDINCEQLLLADALRFSLDLNLDLSHGVK